MSFQLKLKVGFFKKESVKLDIIRNAIIIETESNRKIIISDEDILSIDSINKYQSPELEIHTKNKNYILYLDDLSQEKTIYRNLARFFSDKFFA